MACSQLAISCMAAPGGWQHQRAQRTGVAWQASHVCMVAQRRSSGIKQHQRKKRSMAANGGNGIGSTAWRGELP